MKSLAAHHDTLEELCLTYYDREGYHECGNAHELRMPCSFVAFNALQKLKVTPVFVWGVDGLINKEMFGTSIGRDMLWKCLPRNLSELWVKGAHDLITFEVSKPERFIPDCFLPALDALISQRQHELPKLTSLFLELQIEDWRYQWLDRLADVCQRAAIAGINHVVVIDIEHAYDDGLDFEGVERGWGWNEDVHWEERERNQYRRHRIASADEQDLGRALKDMRKARLAEQNPHLPHYLDDGYYEPWESHDNTGLGRRDFRLDIEGLTPLANWTDRDEDFYLNWGNIS